MANLKRHWVLTLAVGLVVAYYVWTKVLGSTTLSVSTAFTDTIGNPPGENY